LTEERAEIIQRIPIEIENFPAKEIIYGEYWHCLVKLVNK
jgi:hypothetical protein